MFGSSRYFLITDVGSTTTKALLLENHKGELKYRCEASVPTTVEKPFEDVKIGLYRAIKEISSSTGVKVLDADNQFAVPYLTTSSAGGGLQMLVFGLTKAETGRVAQMAAYGAGGVILDTFTADDKISNLEKMKRIRDLKPDIILMAGGIDGGGIWGTLGQAELLSLSDPAPKYKASGKIPLVFCGNVESRGFISEMLADRFELESVANIRPTITELNLSPAQEKVHDLFMTNVMEQAPGYQALKRAVTVDILPTPCGVGRTVSLYADRMKKNVVMLDMGGATTDVFSSIKDKFSRTVSANIGLSYSITNILKEAGIDNIMQHLPESFTETEVRNYICNKMLNPTYLQESSEERLVEVACAVEGIKLAWKHHRDMHFNAANVGFLDRRRKEIFSVFGKMEEIFVMGEETELEKKRHFQLSEINTVIGAGGIFSSSGSVREMVLMLVEGISPSGVTKLAVDRNFKSPHMGVFAQLDEDKAVRSFIDSSLEELGYVIAPIGSIQPGKKVMTLVDLASGEEKELRGGDVLYMAKGGKYEIRLKRNFVLSNTNISGIYEIDTQSPIVFDCRGKGGNSSGRSVFAELRGKDTNVREGVESKFPASINSCEPGVFKLKRALPYQGRILVTSGEQVSPDTVLGRNDFELPKVYLIDLKRLIGYDYDLKKEEVKAGLLVKLGDKIVKEQPIFKLDFKITGEKFYLSSVEGTVEKIEAGGMIIVREVQDYCIEPLSIDISEALGVQPDSIIKYLDCRKGDFVAKGQMIASKVKNTVIFDVFGKMEKEKKLFSEGNKKGDLLKVMAPKSGTVKEIDLHKGCVVMQYDAKPVAMNALITGVVSEVTEGSGVVVAGKGVTLYGKIGFGGEAAGRLKLVEKDLDDSFAGCIAVFSESINKDILLKASECRVKGIVAPSIDNEDLVAVMGEELGVGVTGSENIDFVVVLTEGFGSMSLDAKLKDYFCKAEGKSAAVFGTTRIRAGVKRPKIIVSDV